MLSKVFAFSALAAGALAQTTTPAPTSTGSAGGAAQTTITALLGEAISSGVVGSVISANPCGTTIQLICTDEAVCGQGEDVPITFTQGPNFFQFSFVTTTEGATGGFTETCSLAGPSGAATSAVCTNILSAASAGQTTTSSSVATLSQKDILYGQVPITAGGDKLAAATGSCTSTSNAAVPTGVSDVYKVAAQVGAVVIGAALL